MEDRVEEVGNKFVIKNKKYKELAKSCIDIHYQIRDNLPDHIKDLISEYEQSILQCNVYQKKSCMNKGLLMELDQKES
jgi:hypothetical protein